MNANLRTEVVKKQDLRKRVYFELDNLPSILNWLSAQPSAPYTVLIGSDNQNATRILIRFIICHDLNVIKWMINKMSADQLEIKVVPKMNKPQGMDL